MPTLKIQTLEGDMEAKLGDYIIKGFEGEFYPCDYDIFHKTYDLIEEEQLKESFYLESESFNINNLDTLSKCIEIV